MTVLATAVVDTVSGAVGGVAFGTETLAGTAANTSAVGTNVLTTDPSGYTNANGQPVESTRVSININISAWDAMTTIQQA